MKDSMPWSRLLFQARTPIDIEFLAEGFLHVVDQVGRDLVVGLDDRLGRPVLEELALVHAVAGRVAAPVEDGRLVPLLAVELLGVALGERHQRVRLYLTFQSMAIPLTLKARRPFFFNIAVSFRLRKMLISRSRMYFLMVELTILLQGAAIVCDSLMGASYAPDQDELSITRTEPSGRRR
jgi:hypothetical protein